MSSLPDDVEEDGRGNAGSTGDADENERRSRRFIGWGGEIGSE